MSVSPGELSRKNVSAEQNPLQLIRSESIQKEQEVKLSPPEFHINVLPEFAEIVTGALTTMQVSEQSLDQVLLGSQPSSEAANFLQPDSRDTLLQARRSPRSSYHIHSRPKRREIECASRIKGPAKKSKIPNLPAKLIEYGEVALASTPTQYVFKNRASYIQGHLIVTNYKVSILNQKTVFTPLSDDFLRLSGLPRKYFVIPNAMVSKVDKVFEKRMPDCFFIDISTKDRRNLRFCFYFDQVQIGNNDISLILFRACFPSKPAKEIFAFHMSLRYQEEGWEVYDPILQFIRQGVELYLEQDRLASKPGSYSNFTTDELSPDEISSAPHSPFRLSFANRQFKLSSTYPSLLIVPKSISDEDLTSASQFRTKERLPVLTWYSQRYGTSIWRSSQSKAGLTNSRSSDDEKLLLEIAKTLQIRDIHPALMIYDARSYMAAFGNKIAGKGYENKHHYKYCDVVFCDIDNIHAVRQSYKKMKKLTNAQIEQASIFKYSYFLTHNFRAKFHSQLEHTGWLQTLSTILHGAVKASNSIRERKCVLVHCSDGWDRTSQIASLAQLLLDPYFRTIRGFQVLIEKDWLAFGHQFAKRCGHATRHHKDEDRSPVFIQWLDCVHQLLVQYPTSFEFNHALLLKLAHHVYTCKYGTFLCNCARERVELMQSTVSIWSQITKRGRKYLNPFYVANQAELEPACLPGRLRLWQEHFLKWNSEWHGQNKLFEPGVSSPLLLMESMMWDARQEKEINKSLELEIRKLKRTLLTYEKCLKKHGLPLPQEDEVQSKVMTPSGVLMAESGYLPPNSEK